MTGIGIGTPKLDATKVAITENTNPVIQNSPLTSYIKNYNNVPLNISLQFSLEVNGSTFQYTVTYELAVNATEIKVELPKSTVESVKISYQNQNLSEVNQNVFVSPSKCYSRYQKSILV